MKLDGSVLAVISVGGGLGALARYGLERAIPAEAGHVPWATLLTNVLGCFLIGVVTVAVTEVYSAPALVRPLLVTGFLGGFTTFSTYALEVHGLAYDGHLPVAFFYLVGTLLLALGAVLAGLTAARFAAGALTARGD